MNQSIRIGIGCGGDPDAFASGRAIAQQALSEGQVEAPDLVLAFCHGRLDAREFLRGLRSQVGEAVSIIGGSSIGIITRDFLSYTGCPAGAVVLQWDGLCRRTASAEGLNRGEFEAGWKLGAQLAGQVEQKLLLMFYDSIRASPTGSTPPMMNASPPLIRGIEEGLAQPRVPIFGAGVVGGYDFGPTWQFCGNSAGQQSVVGCLLGGRMQFAVQVMHGCEPMDGLRRRITRMSGSIIRELDGRPIVEFMDEIYGDRAWRGQRPVKRLALGVHRGDRFSPFREDEFVNRLIAGALPGNEGILLFEPDLEEGMEVLFMLRDGRLMIESARRNALEVQARVARSGRAPRLGLYIDCAGRAAEHSETLTEEAAEVQEVFRNWGVPLLGFYSGVEVAPMLGRSRGLDWTGVLLVLTED